MSLVAYAVDSEEEASGEDSNDAITISKSSSLGVNKNSTKTNTSQANNAHYEDADDDWFESDEIDTRNKPLIFAKLPLPQQQTQSKEFNIEEEKDDEFLHKTAQVKTNKVKISIPSLHDFKNLDIKYKDTIRDPDAKPLRRTAAADANKTSKLLSLLPVAKSEQNFIKTNTNVSNKVTSNEDASSTVKKSYFVPDSVRLGRSARNTEGIDEVTVSMQKGALNKTTNKRKHIQPCDEIADESDNEDSSCDFFSLKSNDAVDLQGGSLNEINAMVAERSAKIKTTADTYLQKQQQQEQGYVENTIDQSMEPAAEETNYASVDLDAETLRTLAGRKAAKRAKLANETVQIMEIKANEIMPNREEWMRTALASSTSYQPTGQLTDEEPQAGTRRKHQITYLAHKAKANEAELQAMWAANRQSRRATQSKYGF